MRTQHNADPTTLELDEYTNLVIEGLTKLKITPDETLFETGYYQQAINDGLTVNDTILELAADHLTANQHGS